VHHGQQYEMEGPERGRSFHPRRDGDEARTEYKQIKNSGKDGRKRQRKDREKKKTTEEGKSSAQREVEAPTN
jgi:hypothetical protein